MHKFDLLLVFAEVRITYSISGKKFFEKIRFYIKVFKVRADKNNRGGFCSDEHIMSA